MADLRTTYVISDLHLGGAYPQGRSDRGFRMMTNPARLAAFIEQLAANPAQEQVELVINGDFIDFLAEEHLNTNRWTPFLSDGQQAATTLQNILKRPQDRPVFEALGRFLHQGHALTIVLGNHDIELSLPEARAAFEKFLGIERQHSYRFIYDGEAYQVGDALIEHGNRYDPANVVDHDGLRRIRSLHSRRQYEYQEGHFSPPARSRVVTEVMNLIKSDYAFIDLLKPESEPLFALLLALEPGYRRKLSTLSRDLAKVPFHLMDEPDLPSYTGDIAARGPSPPTRYKVDISAAESDGDTALRRIISDIAGEEAATGLMPPVSYKQEIAFGFGTSLAGFSKLLFAGGLTGTDKRLRWVQQTLGAVQNDQCFEVGVETSARYLEAAKSLSHRHESYRWVIFGHTHHVKDVKLPGGAGYLNTGTWANLMRFPKELFVEDGKKALETLKSFFEDLRDNKLETYIEFRPTYVRLDVNQEGRVEKAGVHTFNG